MSSTSILDVEMPIDEAAWHQFHGMIRAQVYQFARHYNCMHEIEEMMSEASVGFVRAFQKYDPEKGTTLETWVFTKVRSALMEFIRVRARRMKRSGPLLPLDDSEALSYEQRSFADVMDSIEMSEDAKQLVTLILGALPAIRIETTKSNPLRSIREFMREQYGWSNIRAEITFDEIRDALFG